MSENRMMIQPAFEAIQEMKEFLPMVRGCLAGSNLALMKVLNDLEKMLSARGVNEFSHVLNYEISQETERQIGFSRGYTPTISIDKLVKLLEQVATVYEKQSMMSKTDLIKLLKQQEQLILDQEKQKNELQDNINDILEFTEKVAVDAKQKGTLNGTRKQTKV